MKIHRDKQKFKLCFLGPMLGGRKNRTISQGQILYKLFKEKGHICTISSKYKNIMLRLIDILFTFIRNRRNIDIVIIMVFSYRSFYFSLFSTILASFMKKKIIHHIHGGAFPIYMSQKTRLVKKMIYQGHAIVVPSLFISNEISKYGYAPYIISNVLEINNYRFRLRDNIKPRLLWMRTFDPVYNPLMAVKSLKILHERFPSVKLTMAGADRGYERTVHEYVSTNGLNDHVDFVGFINDIQKNELAESYDIYLNTNRIDNQPVSMLEAAAYGYIIISTNVGGIKHLISDKYNGILVKNDDHEEMAEAIIKVLESSELALKLSKNARKLAEKSSWSNVYTQWVSCFIDIFTKGHDEVFL